MHKLHVTKCFVSLQSGENENNEERIFHDKNKSFDRFHFCFLLIKHKQANEKRRRKK